MLNIAALFAMTVFTTTPAPSAGATTQAAGQSDRSTYAISTLSHQVNLQLDRLADSLRSEPIRSDGRPALGTPPKPVDTLGHAQSNREFQRAERPAPARFDKFETDQGSDRATVIIESADGQVHFIETYPVGGSAPPW